MNEISSDYRHGAVAKSHRELGEVMSDGECGHREVLPSVLHDQARETLRAAGLPVCQVKAPHFELRFVDEVFGQCDEVGGILDMFDVRDAARVVGLP